MKRTERHRLKENELSHVLGDAASRVAENRRTFGMVMAVVLVALVAAVGYWAWTTRTETRAQLMLTDALLIIQAPVDQPPAADGTTPVKAPGSYPSVNARAEAALAKFIAVYNAYPSAKAGVAARYYAGSALAMLGRSADAASRYQEVVDRAGTKNFYGRMAQLGRIESLLLAKQFDQAIASAQALANNTSDDSFPRDAVLMELGRAYAAAGKKAEAKQTIDKMLADFPQSTFAEEGRKLLTTLA